jgi:hypothetical protein
MLVEKGKNDHKKQNILIIKKTKTKTKQKLIKQKKEEE